MYRKSSLGASLVQKIICKPKRVLHLFEVTYLFWKNMDFEKSYLKIKKKYFFIKSFQH